jgi:hypothetical protein
VCLGNLVSSGMDYMDFFCMFPHKLPLAARSHCTRCLL